MPAVQLQRLRGHCCAGPDLKIRSEASRLWFLLKQCAPQDSPAYSRACGPRDEYNQ